MKANIVIQHLFNIYFYSDNIMQCACVDCMRFYSDDSPKYIDLCTLL